MTNFFHSVRKIIILWEDNTSEGLIIDYYLSKGLLFTSEDDYLPGTSLTIHTVCLPGKKIQLARSDFSFHKLEQ